MNPLEGFRRQEGKTLTFWPKDQIETPCRISMELILELIRENQNARVCFHTGPFAEFHDMLIIEWRNKYSFPMHRHKKTETIQIIRGGMSLRILELLECRLFRDDGFHIPADSWHQTVPISDYVIYREIKPGPFAPEDNEFWTGEEHP
jgi:cupin fold WbuC family metalloprotein